MIRSMKNAGIQVLLIALYIACNSGVSTESGESVRWWTNEDRQFVVSELNRTTNELKTEIEYVTDDQWNFRGAAGRWSIAEIVEHLEMQNQLHFREISVVSKTPQYLEFRSITEGKDTYFSDYSNDPRKGKAQWFLIPLGRFCSQEEGKAAFYKARMELTQLIKQTDIDFRKQFTFRTSVHGKEVSELKIGEVRDLHQLLLTGIAHTDRHLQQIRKIKQHQGYPKNNPE